MLELRLLAEDLPPANSWVQLALAGIALVNTVLLSLLHSRVYRRDGWRGIGGRSGRTSTRVQSCGRVRVEVEAAEDFPGDPHEGSSRGDSARER